MPSWSSVDNRRWVQLAARRVPGPGTIVLVASIPFTWRLTDLHTYADLADEQENVMSLLSKCLEGVSGGPGAQGFSDQKFQEQWPILFELMSLEKDDEGKKRITSTLLLMVEDGQCKGCLRERNHDCTLWSSSSSILGVLTSLEEQLGSPPVPWRSNKKQFHRR